VTAQSTDLGTPVGVRGSAPQAVLIDGERAVVWTGPDGQPRAARDVCPHRRAPLSAGTVIDGALQCAYHGWTYDGAGRCTLVPAIGPDGRIPPRAQLQLLPVPDELVPAPPVADVDLGDPHAGPGADWLDGDTPGLERFWHPVARLDELATDAGGLDVELLGRIWRLSPDGAGAWTATATDGDAAWGVVTHLDHVWLAPTAPLAPLPVVPEWTEPGWHRRRTTRAEGRYGVGLLLDNQLDAGHFAFVHTTTFGTPEAALLPATEVVRDGTTVSSTMRIPIAAGNDPLARAGEHRLQQHRTMHYEFHPPLWLRLRLDYEDMGGSTLLLFAFTPLGAGRARMDVDVLFRHPDGFTDTRLDERMAFEERVLGEDLGLQRRFEDLRLPLEPAVELHTKADRLSLQCRQVLRELLAR
jgi:phenylpropionate dioxygenase-like ring-hydroxylating dioxygenase large terminal subunit